MREERERVAAEYRRRDADRRFRARYDPADPVVRRMRVRLREDIREILAATDLLPLAGSDILEIGCGSGARLEDLVALGASIERVRGVDLSAERLALASPELSPRLLQADAAALPFPDACFDIVAQFTTLSSILDRGLRRRVAGEMTRVLRPSGAILWYDMRRPSRSSRTAPLGARDIRELFPGFAVVARDVTLAPPLERALSRTAVLARALAALPLLRTHLLAVARRAP